MRSAPEPTPIASQYVHAVSNDLGTYLVVPDVQRWCERAATEHLAFAQLGAPSATRTRTLSAQPSRQSVRMCLASLAGLTPR